MSCTDNFCYNIGDVLRNIRDTFENHCKNSECVDVLLPEEKQALTDYIAAEFLDRRAMELARCFVLNVLRTKRDKAVKQFNMISSKALTGRMNPDRNILSNISECEKMGISAIASNARFMGAIATVLKCNASIIKLDMIRKLLNDTEWRFSMTFNSVQRTAIEELLEIFHNYIVGVICGNPTRTWSPNIMYAYGLYASQCPKTIKRDFCTVLEKIETLPQQESVKDFILKGKLTCDLFLSIIAQIAFTLEIMQSKMGFVHYDLHMNNILMRPVLNAPGNGVGWSYLLYGNEYKMKSQFLPTIIDFGYSCFSRTLIETGEATLDSEFVGMGYIRKYGVMNFMIPGYDMFLVLNNIRVIILSTLDKNSPRTFIMDPFAQKNYLLILDFIDHVLKNIYEVPELMPRNGSSVDSSFKMYNVLLCKGAGLTPLGLLDQLSLTPEQQEVTKKLLQVSRLPWTTTPRESYVPPLCKKKIPLFIADIMPNWKSIIEEDQFFRPAGLLEKENVVDVMDTLIGMMRTRKIFSEFDYRPLMMNDTEVSMDALDFYEKLIFDIKGFYYGYFQNTILFYNLCHSFLNTYYYAYHVKDKEYLDLFLTNSEKVSVLMDRIQKPGYFAKLAGMVRFGQSIAQLKKAADRKFCCAANLQAASLGQLGQSIRQQKIILQQQARPDIFRLDEPESSPCTTGKDLKKLQQQKQKQSQQQQSKSSKHLVQQLQQQQQQATTKQKQTKQQQATKQKQTQQKQKQQKQQVATTPYGTQMMPLPPLQTNAPLTAYPPTQVGYTGQQPAAQGYAGQQSYPPAAQAAYTGQQPMMQGVAAQGAMAGYPSAAQAGYTGQQPTMQGAPAQAAYAGQQPVAQAAYAGQQPVVQTAYAGQQPVAQGATPQGYPPVAQAAYAGQQPMAQGATQAYPPATQAYPPATQAGYVGPPPPAQAGMAGLPPPSMAQQPQPPTTQVKSIFPF